MSAQLKIQYPTVVQGTLSNGFGGLEMVIVDFHHWLQARGVRSFILVREGSELQKRFCENGDESSLLVCSARSQSFRLRKQWDSANTAHLFHGQQELKSLIFRQLDGKVSALAHTFYNCRKRDLFHRLFFAKVNRWIALTENQKENLLDCVGADVAKADVIPNGVDLLRYSYHPKPCPLLRQKIRIAVIARLDRQKGQDVAIEALAGLRHIGVDAELSLIGEDTPQETPTAPLLKDLAERLGVSDFVHFKGFQSDLPSVLEAYDITWMPSYKETFGRCIIEAMAFGLPVIASRAGGVPEIIQHGRNGLLFETKNADDLVAKTFELISNPQLFASIQKQARQDSEDRYDIEFVWRRLLFSILPKTPACLALLGALYDSAHSIAVEHAPALMQLEQLF